MAWLLFVDTSRHTDYMLILGVTCVDAALTLYVAIVTGFGLAALGLTVFLILLIAATGYARVMWKREQVLKALRRSRPVRIRVPR